MSWEYYKALRDTLEVINFGATPVLAFLAYKGLKQIKVTRDIARMQARRESFRLATEKCELFAKEIIPLWSEFEKFATQKKLSEKVVITEKPESISVEFKGGGKWFEELGKCGNTPWQLANSLEGWAMWFTCKIADEGIAFRPCGVAFCGAVYSLIPLLVNSNQKDKLFTHTLQLYTTWRNRIDLEKNLAKQQQLEKERKTLKVENIKPIGT
jgi:hypothetical protein